MLSRTFLVILIAKVFLFYAMANQSTIDSLENRIDNRPDDTTKVKDLIALYEATLYTNADRALGYCQQAYQLSKQLDYAMGVGTALKDMGVLFQYKGMYDSARYYYRKASVIFTVNNHFDQEAASMANMASTYYDQGNYEMALSYIDSTRKLLKENPYGRIEAFLDNTTGSIYLFKGYYLLATEYKTKVKNYYTQTGNDMRLADAEKDLGLIFNNLDKPQKALEAYRTSAAIYQRINDNMFLGEVCINMGNTFVEIEQYDSARFYLNRGLDLVMETNFRSLMAVSKESIGLLTYKMGQVREALKILEDGLAIAREIEDMYQQSSIHTNLGDIYLDNGDLYQARTHLNQALKIAQQIDAVELLKTIHYQFYRLHELEENSELALKSYLEYDRLADSLYQEKQTKQLAEFEILYEMEKNRQIMKDQLADIQLLTRDNRIQRQQKSILLAGIIIVVLLTILTIFVLRNKHKQTKIENLKKEQDQQKEIELKKRELASYTLHLAQKNQLLDELKEDIANLEASSSNGQDYATLRNKVNYKIQIDKDWEMFKKHFEEVHPEFFSNLQYQFPNLSNNDMRLLALLKLNLSSKEIAAILNITPDSVKKSKYRLKKKMEIEDDASIVSFIEINGD